MSETGHYNRGDVVLRRSRRGSVVTWVQATRVVRDDEDGLLLWLPAGAGFGHRADDQGQAIREEPIDVVATRQLVASQWKNNSVLIWNPAGADHSLWWFFAANVFTGWYVNLEIRGPRWSDGQRCGIDVADLGLDVVVDPDRTSRWKDEDDFATFTDAPGYWTADQAVAARAEGRRVIALAEEGKFPFDGTYCDFVPDPTWSPPELPPGWGTPPR
jgi:predicted RNA-binding protein associated with RNAse of E/G family